MPDRKKMPARSKLTKRADLLRDAVRRNEGRRDRYVRGAREGIGTPSTMEHPAGAVTGRASLARHNKTERAAEPTGNGPKTKVAVVRGRETTVATGPRGSLHYKRANANGKPNDGGPKAKAKKPVTRKRLMASPKKARTAGLGKGLRV